MRRPCILAAVAAAAAILVAPAPAAWPAQTWDRYDAVHDRLVRDVNAFIATYNRCARREGLGTTAWGACVEPARVRLYNPTMLRMDAFLQKAIRKVESRDPCFAAIHGYVSRNVAARLAATHVVTDARLGKTARAEIMREHRTFVTDRNRAAKGRLRVNAICSP